MALETMRAVHAIGDATVRHTFGKTCSSVENPDIDVNHDENTIKFTIQNGPIKEHGRNGCQVDALIHVARRIITGLNQKFPCRENSCAITKLDEAMMWLRERTADRETRGVEGTNQG
ncbi:hypothetical protein LCGC14_1993940 [marine sediment metagenome]|uniref:Acb2/Tad1 hairpin domain-containing protein n=1 Tax=marine sediment metagenome TaxID=412755 RepID=A0A0F9I2E6_9ZZZZ